MFLFWKGTGFLSGRTGGRKSWTGSYGLSLQFLSGGLDGWSKKAQLLAVDSEFEIGGDVHFMGQALRQAQLAYAAQEVPIGCVVVKDERVIGRAWNQVETLKDATAHAEMLALTAAQQAVGDWRLEGCTLYVTKEPCPMCAGAIVHCRPDRVVFGCADGKGGAAGGWINLLESNPPLNHRCEVVPGVMEDECLSLLQSFFREARAKKKAERDGSVE